MTMTQNVPENLPRIGLYVDSKITMAMLHTKHMNESPFVDLMSE